MKADEEKVVVMNEEQRGLRTELRGKNQTGLRLLLVDDEEINRYLIEQYVVGTSIELDVARDGAEGVEKACRERYDVILMDIRMPVMSGLEATRLIRSWEREHDLEPAIIVAFTASLVGEEIRFALAAGCTAHLPKPATRNDLLDLVGRLLSDRA